MIPINPSSLDSLVADSARAQQALLLAASDDVAARLVAARRFRELARTLDGDESAVAALAEILSLGGPNGPATARLLAAIGGPAAAGHLLAAAESTSQAVSQSALHALVNLVPNAESGTLLCSRWPVAQTPSARYLLALAISRQPGPDVLAWANGVLASRPKQEFAVAIIQGIAVTSRPEVDGWLAGLAAAAQAEVSLAAQIARLRSGCADALEAIIAQAAGGKRKTRLQALAGLYGAPFAGVVAVFADALGADDSSMREAGLLGAPFVAGPELIVRAAALLRDPRKRVAHQAQAVFWLLTGQIPELDPPVAMRQAVACANRLPAAGRCLLGKPFEPRQLTGLLSNPSYAACADAALRMISVERPEFRPDCDAIRNLDAIDAWERVAAKLSKVMTPGGRYYAGSAIRQEKNV